MTPRWLRRRRAEKAAREVADVVATAAPRPPLAVELVDTGPPEPVLPPAREKVIGSGVAWLARWSWRCVGIFLFLGVFGLAVWKLWPILLPLLLALVLSTVLDPPARWLERKLGFPPALAAATVMLAGLAVVVGGLWAVIPSVVDQSDDISTSVVQGLQKLQDWVQESSLDVTREQIDTAIQALQDRIQGNASSIASGVLVGVGAVTSALATLVIALVTTFFLVKDGPRFGPWLAARAGRTAGPHLLTVGGRMWATLGGFIRTQALVSLIDAVFIGLGLVLVGVPLAIPLAILTFFGGFVPIVGAFVVGAIAVLVALVSNGVSGALIILAVIVAVQQLEGNVLSPWLQARSMRLHPAIVLLSVTLGGSLFGIIGAFLAVPVAAVVAVGLRYLDDEIGIRAGEQDAA